MILGVNISTSVIFYKDSKFRTCQKYLEDNSNYLVLTLVDIVHILRLVLSKIAFCELFLFCHNDFFSADL